MRRLVIVLGLTLIYAAQCGDDVLCVRAHVDGMFHLDVRASLSVKLVNERLQLVDRYRLSTRFAKLLAGPARLMYP